MTQKQDDEARAQDPSLDEVLISLQKSFSRLSKQSAYNRKLTPNDARALIVGEVEFNLSLKVTPEKDRLVVSKNGEMDLTVNGHIQTDIRGVSEVSDG